MIYFEIRNMFNKAIYRSSDRQDAENYLMHIEDMYGFEDLRLVEIEEKE